MAKFFVKQQTEFGSRNWGVYRLSNEELVEGGFFSRSAANAAMRRHERESERSDDNAK